MDAVRRKGVGYKSLRRSIRDREALAETNKGGTTWHDIQVRYAGFADVKILSFFSKVIDATRISVLSIDVAMHLVSMVKAAGEKFPIMASSFGKSRK
jgi:hypothetical protein